MDKEILVHSPDGLREDTSSTFKRPMGLTIAPMSNFYVADWHNYRVQLFYPNRSNGTTIAGNDSTSLGEPYTLALDNQLNLYV